MYRPKDTTLQNAKYRKLWHFTTTLAKNVAAQMNDDPERLNRFFKTVLESSNMIQIKSTFQMTSDTEGKFTKMLVIYPPVFEESAEGIRELKQAILDLGFVLTEREDELWDEFLQRWSEDDE